MARSFNGSSDFGRYAGVPFTASPFTMACWFNSGSATAAQTLMGVFTSADLLNRIYIEAAGNVAGDPVRAVVRDAGTAAVAASSTGYSTSTWHHACGVFASTTSRDAFIDGGSKGSNTTSKTPSGWDRTSVGVVDSSSQVNWMNGNLAELGWWDVALTDAEVLSLARGISPRKIRPGNLVRYEPFWGKGTTEREMIGGAELTLTGTGAAAHPRILRERPRNRWRAAAVAPPPASGRYRMLMGVGA